MKPEPEEALAYARKRLGSRMVDEALGLYEPPKRKRGPGRTFTVDDYLEARARVEARGEYPSDDACAEEMGAKSRTTAADRRREAGL